ncbi:Cell division cycle-associated 7 [Chlorella sorokiniana]|uniref:Cell division cycle-associated 7 n=1 Tax=Chlorella sorokiniana TaxID=3076 RepID=A0A2P6TZ42_CHLSO|nr:Cell division cycle-associated 7 [Chlorella sorokiniana]|eukprot:PRW59310.1 Cell division cycle-associated 7 [Chlorella sorokiniana]
MATHRFAADQQGRRGMLLATQAAGAADPEDGEPLPALAAVPGLVAGAAAGPATSQGGEVVASGGAAAAAAAAAAASTGTRSRGRSELRDGKVQGWLQLAKRSRMGPRLLELRDTQRRSGLPIEKYGLAHVYTLGTARHVWEPEARQWCKDIHRKRDRDGRPIRCTQCTTCHWCRQKTPQVKTECSACHANRDNVYGGPYAGVICGNCLWTRFGENLREVRDDENWLCPACRQICNCSANNCVRNKNGWVPTNQLISEAESLGYESVAHYLVLSQLDEDLLANITDNVHSLQPMLDPEVARKMGAARQRQRGERDQATALLTAAETLVDRELAVIRAATGLTDERVNAVAARNQQLLAALGFGQGTLAADLMDDDEDDDELLPSPAAARAGSVAPASSALGPTASRGSPAGVSSALQQALHPSLVAPGLTQLSGSLERLDGLLHRDANAAFPAGLPDGDGVLPGLALGLRPAAARGALRQAGAPGLPPPGLPRPPLRPHLQQQQARLTPVAVPGSKQARAASVEPGAGGRLAAAGQQAAQPMDVDEAAEEAVRHRSTSPVEVAEPSQQLGLSPGAAEMHAAAGTAAAQQAGASPAVPGPGAAVSPPAAKPAPGEAAAAAAGPPPAKRNMSSLAADWHCLQQTAWSLVDEVLLADPRDRALFVARCYILTMSQAEARYNRMYECNIRKLQGILAKANGWLTEPLVVMSAEDYRPATNALPFDALREMVNLYICLATALPDDDVWQVVQRLVCQDCFVDCDGSHWSARFVLLEAWIEVRKRLFGRKLHAPLRSVYRAISDVVASLAEDGAQLQRLLSQIQQALHGSSLQQLPQEDQCIGPYRYDAAERARGLSQVYTKLQQMGGLVNQLLFDSLQLCLLEASELKHDAIHLISPRLVAALLGSGRGVTHESKLAGAGLVFCALKFSCLQQERQQELQLSVDEINRRREERLSMCQVVKEVLPVLEGVVAADYPLWRGAGAAMEAARQGAQAALSTGAASGPAFAQTLGQKGLNTLTHAYAFLMECGQMSWQELEEKAIRPYSSPATFWQLSNRVYRGFGMSLIADTLQLVSNLSMPEPRARAWLLRHWLLCLLDRSRRFNTGEKLTLVLSQVPETRALFAGLEPAQLAVGADGLGQQTAVVLCHVVRALARDFSWRPHLPELLQGLDELLERRDKEVAATDARSRADRLRYGTRLYRLLGAVLLAATPLMPLPPAVAPPGPSLAATVDQLRRLAQRMAMLVVGSCLAVHREYAAQRAAKAAAGRVGLAALDVEDDLGSALRSLGDVRQRLQALPIGQLSVLWQVLLAWGAPAACQSMQQLLKPVVAVVGCALELCSGETEASPFDQAVLERLADSLLALPEEQQLALRQANAGAASLAQFREFVLGTLLRRYLGRCHIATEGAQRSAVNAVRLLEVLLRSLRGEDEVQGALLPLLWSLLDALRPRIPPDSPVPADRPQEAIISMLARLLEQGGPVAQLLPPLSGPQAGNSRAAVVSRVLHSFWSAAASDALLCCGQQVWSYLDEPRRQLYRTKLQADGPPRLLPRDMDPAAIATVNTVSGLCGRLAQQWTVNVEQLCAELSKQLDIMRREAAASLSGAAAALQQPPGTFRPADFGWTLAYSALHLFSAFLQAHQGGSTAQPGTMQTQPEASCMGGNTVMAGPSVAPQRRPMQQQQQPQQQQQGRGVALPAASGIAGSAAAARPAAQQQVQVKQEPLSQAAGPAAVRQQSQVPPAALGPGQQAQRLDRDVSFAELADLPSRSLVQLVGYLRRRPSIKDGKRGRVLQLDLGDHKRRRLALLVQQADEPQLFAQLQAEATRRFDSQPNQLHMVRASNATLLELAAGGAAAAAGSAAAAVSSSGRGSGGSAGGQQAICLLQKSGHHVPSVGWDPTGERAASIQRAFADGLIRMGDQPAGPPAVLATQATVLQPSVHRPETQVTPAMNWTPQLRGGPGGSPGATQVADAGGDAGTSLARPAGAYVPATQAAMSQAPAAAVQRAAGAAGVAGSAAAASIGGAAGGKTPWQQLALDVAALLQPHGFSRMDAITAVRRYQGERDVWVARGARALAADICRLAGKPPQQ